MGLLKKIFHGGSKKLRAIADPIGSTLARKNKNTWWGKRYTHVGRNLRRDLGLRKHSNMGGSNSYSYVDTSSYLNASNSTQNSSRSLSRLTGGV